MWDSTYRTHLRSLVLLQKRIIRIISKKGINAHTNPLFETLTILKLEDIYSLHLEKFMFSLKNNSVPSSFSRSMLRSDQVHGYNTRSSNKFYIPFCRTNIRKFSVFYQGPVFFNKLKAFICDAHSLYSFQSRVKNFLLSCYWILNLNKSLFSFSLLHVFLMQYSPRIFTLLISLWLGSPGFINLLVSSGLPCQLTILIRILVL